MGIANDQRDKRRKEILEAAAALIVEKGYEKASLQEIANRAHASKETIYAWFGSKSDMLVAIFRESEQSMRSGVAANAGGNPQPREVLYFIASALLRAIAQTPMLKLFAAAVVASRENPELKSIVAASINRGQLAVYLEQCRAKGLMKFEDADRMARLFIAMAMDDYGTRLTAGLIDGMPDHEIDNQARFATEMFLKIVELESRPDCRDSL